MDSVKPAQDVRKKDSIIAWKDPCSVSVRNMNRKKERKPLERSKLITTRGYELLINEQSR